MTATHEDNINAAALLAWHVAMGADEAIDIEPIDRFVVQAPVAAAAQQPTKAPLPKGGPTPVAARPAKPMSGAGVEEAKKVASACKSLEELQTALKNFDGGLLKRSSKNTVFSGGTPDAPLMVIGDVPSREDDQSGNPFDGPAGQLLDKMLAAIGHNRNDNAYLSSVLPWRPLGSSKPDASTLAVCRPFVERHIELAAPKVILGMGGALGKALFETEDSISRQRGRWRDVALGNQKFALLATYHPTYLISQPNLKGAAWQDLLAVREKLLS